MDKNRVFINNDINEITYDKLLNNEEESVKTTKTTNEIFVTEDIFNNLIKFEREKRLIEAINKLNNEMNKLLKDEWIKIENKKVYYVKSKNFIIADSTRMTCGRTSFNYEFNGYTGRAMTDKEAIDLFYNNKTINPLMDGDYVINKNDDFGISSQIAYDNNSYYIQAANGNDNRCYSCYSNTNVIKIPVFNLNKDLGILENLIRENLLPSKISKKSKELFLWLIEIYVDEDVIFKNKSLLLGDELKDRIINGTYDEICGISYRKQDIINYFKSNKVQLNKEVKEMLISKFLNCDKVRADIESYDVKRLEDPNLGHWDLWTSEDDKKIKITIDESLVGRNPLLDIKEDGLIGIDFGTKSTIVVYQDGDDNTEPMRVGMGQFSKKVDAKHFENPTVMEFINLNDFLLRYTSSNGRPSTLWEEVTVSHTAFNSLISSKSHEYYSYFNDLKQWSGDNSRQIKIRDKKGNEKLLPCYLDIKDGEFDPIELYAYYLGLYINNMHNGIYLNYLLSFPVTYEKAVREKIINSFTRGLKKSLPNDILKNNEVMNKFRVAQGASEPAAYAICALQEYGFDPEDDEKVFYGIFDFGGGTTDFDFGIWRSADEDKESRYDYVINHFGAGGDKFLGGENLLELLAFEVFKANQDKLRTEKIAFLKPLECKKFPGSEVLLSHSQEAKLNTKQLMEKLRPLWERHKGYKKTYESGVLKVNLFDKSGNTKMNFDLDVSKEKLEEILYNRIEKGVRNFFEALKLTFKSEITKDLESIVIFLAGNSSKSPIVAELFNKYITEITNEIKAEMNLDKEYFKIYPPLGSKEAIKIQKEKEIEVDDQDITRPTGKTGVAYGLVEGRDGGVIKVISEKKSTDEIKFNYYIGRNRKKKFKTIIDRDVKYNKWIKFISAEKADFEFYYTNLPEATTNSISIKEISKKTGRVNFANEDLSIYIRAIAPSIIEYTVSNDEGIKSNKLLSDIVKVELK